MSKITRRSRAIDRVRRIAAALLLLVGLLLLAEAVVTLAWKEPLGAISADREQRKLSEELRQAESEALAAPTGFVANRDRSSRSAVPRRYKRRTERGEPLGRIELPALGEAVVPVTVNVPTNDLIDRLMEVGSERRIAYRLSGAAELDRLLFGTLPFERDGELRLPELPGLARPPAEG